MKVSKPIQMTNPASVDAGKRPIDRVHQLRARFERVLSCMPDAPGQRVNERVAVLSHVRNEFLMSMPLKERCLLLQQHNGFDTQMLLAAQSGLRRGEQVPSLPVPQAKEVLEPVSSARPARGKTYAAVVKGEAANQAVTQMPAANAPLLEMQIESKPPAKGRVAHLASIPEEPREATKDDEDRSWVSVRRTSSNSSFASIGSDISWGTT